MLRATTIPFFVGLCAGRELGCAAGRTACSCGPALLPPRRSATSTTTNAGKATALAADRSRPVQWTRLRFPSLYSVKGHFRPRRTAEELCRLVDWLSGWSGILHQPACGSTTVKLGCRAWPPAGGCWLRGHHHPANFRSLGRVQAHAAREAACTRSCSTPRRAGASQPERRRV